MAVKNQLTRIYTEPYEDICCVLRNPDFSQCLDAAFLEEALLPDAVEFRYRRKTELTRYGRNYFIKLQKLTEGKTGVTVVTQSRKVTVLLDLRWKKEVERAFDFLELLLKK